jgi:hypothetical protein
LTKLPEPIWFLIMPGEDIPKLFILMQENLFNNKLHSILVF